MFHQYWNHMRNPNQNYLFCYNARQDSHPAYHGPFIRKLSLFDCQSGRSRIQEFLMISMDGWHPPCQCGITWWLIYSTSFLFLGWTSFSFLFFSFFLVLYFGTQLIAFLHSFPQFNEKLFRKMLPKRDKYHNLFYNQFLWPWMAWENWI